MFSQQRARTPGGRPDRESGGDDDDQATSSKGAAAGTCQSERGELREGRVRRGHGAGNWACSDDLAIISLAPGEEASPHNWRAGVQRSVLRDSLPAGRYEIVIRIQANDETIRAGFVTID